jgi:hypothetical protein
MSKIEYLIEGKEDEARAWLVLMAAVRNYMQSQRSVITDEVGMEGAKSWADGLASDVSAVVLKVFTEWEEAS